MATTTNRMPPELARQLTDPMKLAAFLWPGVSFYAKQREVIYSVVDNDETVVPAGNMLGKDFVAGFLSLWFFLTRHPCRVVTTSADYSQLESVLWGEIRRFIQTSRYPLEVERGGPLIVNHLHIRKAYDGVPCGLSYLLGRVASKGEGMLGHHVAETGDGVPRTLFIADEASGVEDLSYERSDTWAKRKMIIGNPYPCTNFFRRGVKGGDVPGVGGRLYRKVIRIRAEDSPNVRFARAEEAAGLAPSGEVILPGVLPWADYVKRRATWDAVRQCVGLDGEFYEGAETLLFPPAWLNRAERFAELLRGRKRKAKAIGIDPAEGGDQTAMAAVDELGLIELVSRKTPDTSVITGEAIAFMRKHNVPPERVVFDRGGGGKEHADRLRQQGYDVRTVAFGESVSIDPLSATGAAVNRLPLEQQKNAREERYAYRNRRAEMYGALRVLLDPGDDVDGSRGFAIPAEYSELRRQLSPIPLEYDHEGRMVLPPKNKRDAKDTRRTLTEMIGRSPDEADALVLAIHGMQHEVKQRSAGALRFT